MFDASLKHLFNQCVTLKPAPHKAVIIVWGKRWGNQSCAEVQGSGCRDGSRRPHRSRQGPPWVRFSKLGRRRAGRHCGFVRRLRQAHRGRDRPRNGPGSSGRPTSMPIDAAYGRLVSSATWHLCPAPRAPPSKCGRPREVRAPAHLAAAIALLTRARA
jgi:hypothetical protein